MLSASSIEYVRTLLQEGLARPVVRKTRSGEVEISFGECLVKMVPADNRMMVTSIHAPSSEGHVPALLLAAEHASANGRELFIPKETNAHDALSGQATCLVQKGCCAGKPGNFVLYSGPRILKWKSRKTQA